jgi:hypothetical protein
LKTEFERKLNELGFTYHCNTDRYYNLYQMNDINRTIKIKLICSEPVDVDIQGSRNGNQIQAIGIFRFKLSPTGNETDFFIFGFRNKINQCFEYVIIPYIELKSRFKKRNQITNGNKKLETGVELISQNKIRRYRMSFGSRPGRLPRTPRLRASSRLGYRRFPPLI